MLIGIRIPGPPPNLRVTVSGSEIALHISGLISLRFQLQSASEIVGPWADVGTPVASDSAGYAEPTDTTRTGSQYYRVVPTP